MLFNAEIVLPRHVLNGCPSCYDLYTTLIFSVKALYACFQIIVALEGGYNLNSISYSMTMCAKALVGDPLPPIAHKNPKSGAKESIKSVIRQQTKYWSCLKFGLALPHQLSAAEFPEMLPESLTVVDEAANVTERGESKNSSYIPSQVGNFSADFKFQVLSSRNSRKKFHIKIITRKQVEQ